MGQANTPRTHGNAPDKRRGRMIAYTPLAALVAAAFGISLLIAPLPDVQPDSQVAATIVAPNTVYSPVEAPKPLTPTTVPYPAVGDCGAWADYAVGFGWPRVEARQIAEIMHLESRCDPTAIGDGGNSYGLLQIHCPSWVAKSTYWPDGWAAANGYPITCQDLLDPATNLGIGFLIWAGVEGSGGGWWNWTTYRP
jgi:soluble lytic murein transglycosylase-like protein